MADQLPPRVFRLPSSIRLAPIQQGELDGLCGVYSLINALRLVRWEMGKPLREPDHAALFSFAMHRLAEMGDLREMLSRGVTWMPLKQLGRRMVVVTSTADHGIQIAPIGLARPHRLQLMKEALVSRGALIAPIYGDQHYSVIVGWTAKRAILFDSDGSKWVPLESLMDALCLLIRSSAPDRDTDGKQGR